MKAHYERVPHCCGNELRVTVEDEVCTAYYNGAKVAEKVGDVGLLVLEVRENGKAVTDDIAALRSGPVRIFVGRNGRLIFTSERPWPDQPTAPRRLRNVTAPSMDWSVGGTP